MDLKDNVAISFAKVKNDMNALKQNLTGWIQLINSRQKELEYRLGLIEQRIARLEMAKLRYW